MERRRLKEKEVKKLSEDIIRSNTLMIVSIKGLPSKQFQDIKKSIREEADVKVAKKNIFTRAIKALNNEETKKLEKYVEENCAFVISDTEGYELAGILNKKKTPVNAKAGQIAPEDIEVKDGPTNLPPGPAISELGSLGLQVAVEDGKISIKQSKVVINKGQEINENAASILQKLNIQPFKVGLDPVAIYDVKSNKICTEINIDSEKAREELKEISGKALGFAQKIVYYCKETISYLLSKANSHASKLEDLQDSEKREDTSNADKNEDSKVVEEKKDETEKKESDTQLNPEEEK